MDISSVNFAALVGSRICHDLISPIGAINNGMELLALSGNAATPEMALISESVEAANARIRFFRVCYGSASETQNMARKDIVAILRDLTRGSRVTMTWRAEEDVSRAEVQIAFLALQCAETALPYGGEITVDRLGQQWQMTLHADRFSQDEALWVHLTQSARTPEAILPADIKPAHVQFLMLPIALAAKGRSIDIARSDRQITILA